MFVTEHRLREKTNNKVLTYTIRDVGGRNWHRRAARGRCDETIDDEEEICR